MLRIIVEFLTKVGLSIEIKLVKLLSATPTLTDEALSFILFYSSVQYVLYSYSVLSPLVSPPS